MSSDWQMLLIGDICEFYNGKGISKYEYIAGGRHLFITTLEV